MPATYPVYRTEEEQREEEERRRRQAATARPETVTGSDRALPTFNPPPAPAAVQQPQVTVSSELTPTPQLRPEEQASLRETLNRLPTFKTAEQQAAEKRDAELKGVMGRAPVFHTAQEQFLQSNLGRTLPTFNPPAQETPPSAPQEADWQTVSRDALMKPEPVFNPQPSFNQAQNDASATPEAERAALVAQMGGQRGSASANNISLQEGDAEKLWRDPAGMPAVQPAAAKQSATTRHALPQAAPTGAPQFQNTGDYSADTSRYIEALKNYKPEDHNGTWKSIALSAAHMFASALSGGNIAGALGAAIFGATVGAFRPRFDEELAKRYNLSRAEQEHAKDIARHLADLHVKEAEASLATKQAAVANAPAKNDAAARKRDFTELNQRLRAMGGKYYPGQDEALDKLVDKYGFSPKTGGGGGFNPQALRPVGNKLTYTQSVNGKPVAVVLFSNDELTKEEKIRNAIAVEQVNAQLYRNGQPPLMVNPEFMEDGELPAPAQQPQPAPTQDSKPSAQPPAAKTLPTFNPSPASPPPLVTVPGAKPHEPLFGSRRGGGHRGSYHRGGGGSGSGSEKDAGFQIDAINKANNLAKDAEEEADKLKDRGFKDQAQKMRDKAARYRQAGEQVRARVQKNPHVVLNEDGSAAAAGTKPKVKLPAKLRVTW
jgi:hypothetical protein